MINLSKISEFFDARQAIQFPVHVIGCGAIGSHVCEQLARMGCKEIHIWDFDRVEPKNIVNQMFFEYDIGNSKVDACEHMMKSINNDISIIKHAEGIKPPYIVNGYIFLCVDNIDLRRTIVKANEFNPNCRAFFDFRMRLLDGQCYMADRSKRDQLKNFLATMDFTHEEAMEATPLSACGVELSVSDTVKTLVSCQMNNFRRYLKGEEAKTCILYDARNMRIDCFPE